MERKFLLPILLLLLSVVISASAQQSVQSPNAQTPFVKTFRLDSRLMARQMPYNVIFPAAYETEKDARFPVLYFLHGMGGSYKKYAEETKLTEYAARHRVIIVNPEGGNGFYTDSVTKPNDKYESYVVNELIPEIDKNLRTAATRDKRAVAGFSMGGYGALKFGIKYPDKFVLAASISAPTAAASWRRPEDLTSPPNVKNAVLSVFGEKNLAVLEADKSSKRRCCLSEFGEKNLAVLEANDLFKIIGDLPPEKITSLPFIYAACGTEDFLIGQNRNFASLLFEKKIPHEFRQLPGRHDGVFAGPQTQEILRLSERIFAGQKGVSNE